jgi:uncharacterized protein YbjT (DUF2867 family)
MNTSLDIVAGTRLSLIPSADDVRGGSRLEGGKMKVFIVGLAGSVGSLLANELLSRGDHVFGLVRSPEQALVFSPIGVKAHLGNIATIDPGALSKLVAGADSVVFTAGSNGGPQDVTNTVDGRGLAVTIEAARIAGVDRFFSVSVLPEADRNRHLDEDEEHYFAVKKSADVALAHSGLEWLILRPSRLTNQPGAGTVSLSAAEEHGQISREDVAATLAELLHEPRIRRRILELNQGTSTIPNAIHAQLNV